MLDIEHEVRKTLRGRDEILIINATKIVTNIVNVMLERNVGTSKNDMPYLCRAIQNESLKYERQMTYGNAKSTGPLPH